MQLETTCASGGNLLMVYAVNGVQGGHSSQQLSLVAISELVALQADNGQLWQRFQPAAHQLHILQDVE